MSLTELQQSTVERILAIPAVTKRGSGHLQGRMRRSAFSHYRLGALRLGFTDAQIAVHIEQIREVVELERY